MAKTKQQKQEIVEKLTSGFKSAASTVFVSFTRVTVAEESVMRKALREAGVKYVVAKKTLIDRALKAAGHTLDGDLPGEIAVAYNTTTDGDASAPARLIHEFAGKFKDKLVIAGGVFEGMLRSAVAMQEIATIPSMDVLRGRFANVINSPLTRFAVVLSKVSETKGSAA